MGGVVTAMDPSPEVSAAASMEGGGEAIQQQTCVA
jgi:hypothetical protein